MRYKYHKAAIARSECQKEPAQSLAAMHAAYIAMNCLALQWTPTAQHYITLRYITFHCIAVQYIPLNCIALHCIALHCIALHGIALHQYIALQTYTRR